MVLFVGYFGWFFFLVGVCGFCFVECDLICLYDGVMVKWFDVDGVLGRGLCWFVYDCANEIV